MSEHNEITAEAPARKQRKTTKAAAVIKLLSRAKGATINEIMKATDWQAHTCRAFLTGLRNGGQTILKEERPDGNPIYRLEAAQLPAAGDAR